MFHNQMSADLTSLDHKVGSHLCLYLIYIGYFWNSQRGPHICPQTSMLAAATVRKSPPLCSLPLLFLGCWSQYWICTDVISGPVCCLCMFPPSSQGAWISFPNRDGEISSFSNSVLPYISQAQKLLSLHFEISQSLINNVDSSQASPRSSL